MSNKEQATWLPVSGGAQVACNNYSGFIVTYFCSAGM